MEEQSVKVRKISYGKAVFADREFKRGEMIGEIRGKLVRDPDYGSEYCVALNDQVSLEPRAPFRFLNHSCEPNAQLFTSDVEGSDIPTLALYARKNIKPGTELTIDYSWPADAAIHCLCGSKKCRGWVVSKKELPLVGSAKAKATV